MLEFIIGHLSTIIVGAVVALGLGAVVWKLVSDKKKGKSACGCNCADCPSAGLCHTK